MTNGLNTWEDVHTFLQQEAEQTVKWEHGGGTHWMWHNGSGVVAVHAGPHGPDTRATSAGKLTVEQLIVELGEPDIVPISDSVFTKPEVDVNV